MSGANRPACMNIARCRGYCCEYRAYVLDAGLAPSALSPGRGSNPALRLPGYAGPRDLLLHEALGRAFAIWDGRL